MSEKKKVPFGRWSSPISPTTTSKRTRLSDVHWDSDGQTLVWLEGRSAQGVLVASRHQEAPRDLTDQHSVRARVGYGGGDFAVGHGHVLYAHQTDGRLYKQSLNQGQPAPLVPGFGAYASPTISPDGKQVLCVHTYESQDSLVLVDFDGSQWPQKVASGSDFYMSPSWHPDSKRFAWIEWDQPNMPWDGTRLKLATLSEDGSVSEATLIAGDETTSIFQATFSPDGKYLSYITTYKDLDALALYELETGETHYVIEGQVLAAPAWAQGLRRYGWRNDSGVIYYQNNDKGRAQLWAYELATKESTPLDLGPYTWFEQLTVSPVADAFAVFASSTSISSRLVLWDNGRKQIIKRSTSENIPASYHPTPEPLTWETESGETVHAIYYPPAHPSMFDDSLPPAIVNIHGGPTAQSVMSYAADTAFFTSRGYAVVNVNYRGSTGYGKKYMDALRLKWGTLDVEDAVSAAKLLADKKLADPKRIVIKGGSAGGYTVLNTLTHHPGVFRAGISLFGISNMFLLAAGTHKFEARYLDMLIGPLPESAEKYRALSPVFHAHQIKDPLAIFQGAEDKVVPPDQAEAIVKALKQNGTPHVYHYYEGEGHGWRKTETIESYYKSVLAFLEQYVLY